MKVTLIFKKIDRCRVMQYMQLHEKLLRYFIRFYPLFVQLFIYIVKIAEGLIKEDSKSKKSLGVSVAAIPKLHKKIIKAVRKRKALDTEYAFEMAETGKGEANLVPKSKGSELTFTIKFIRKLSAEDL